MSRFLDTNILVYAFLADDPRRGAAERLLAEGGVVSVQVLNEFANVARKKLGWPCADVEAALKLVRGHVEAVQEMTVAVHEAGVSLACAHKLTVYDAMIVAAAQAAGCAQLLSEDLQDGRIFGALSVSNPF